MRVRTVFGVVVASGMLAALVPVAVAGAQEDDPPPDPGTSEVFWLAEETEFRFITRTGEELTEDQSVLELTATLSGANELDPETLEPAAGDPEGTGTATITLRDGGSVCWDITVADITLPAIAAHIHEGGPDVNGPIVVPLGGPDATGASVGCAVAEAALVEAIAANPAGFYVNVHTTDFPSGAVRGQLGGVEFAPNVGDRLFFTENLFASDAHSTRGDQIGTTAIQCTFGVAQTLQCDGTAFLDGRGQVHLTATVPFTEVQAPFDVAVVGGTGQFATAGGDATLTENQATEDAPATTLYAVRITDLAG